MPRKSRQQFGTHGDQRNRSGLRNRRRTGRGTYSRQRKKLDADRYGVWKDGRRTQPEVIARYIRAVDAQKEAAA